MTTVLQTTENTQDMVIESINKLVRRERNDSGLLGLLSLRGGSVLSRDGSRVRGRIHSHRVSVLVRPLDKFKRESGAGKIDESESAHSGGGAYLSVGLTGIFFSTSLPPFSKMKWLRAVLAPPPVSALISTRLGSDRSAYGRLFWQHPQHQRPVGSGWVQK